ncbi:MAG TPA: hypothetical protein DGH68_01590 [Bacteroidetes bacterium]|jgi:ABC-2 type transport system permease protein|nr:hypothetical protein [Bacteroidota bacterium]
MNNIWIITQKELRSYFDSATAYVFIVLFLVLCGTYVVGNIFLENVASLRLLFEVAPILMLVFVPAVTMRLISGEKRQGTFELLGTRPIRIGDIVLGKFLASWVLVVFTILPTATYAIILSSIGRLDWGPVVGGFCGLFLLGGTFVAIGLFASALSNNQVIALIVGSIVISCLFYLDRILPFVPPGLVLSVEYLSAGYHFSSLGRGIVDSRDVVYSISMIVFFLLLAAVASRREYGQSFRDLRQILLRGQALRLVLVGTVLLLANLVSMMMFVRVDLTEGNLYTLSQETKNMLLGLDDDLLVRVYLTPELPPPYHDYHRDIQDLLEEYHAYSRGNFQYGFVSTSDSTIMAQEAAAAGIMPIFLKAVKNDRFQTVRAYAGLALSYADRFESLPIISSIGRLEYELTSTMRRLRAPNVPTIGLLAGHGCPRPEVMKSFLDGLGRHFRVSSISLSDFNTPLSNVDALLIIGPKLPFSQDENLILDQYIMNGGRVAFLVDGMNPNVQKRVANKLSLNLDNMFDSYGWCVDIDLVLDKQCAGADVDMVGGTQGQTQQGPNPFLPVVADFDGSTVMLANRFPVVLPYASSIDVRLASARGIATTVLARSSSLSGRLTGDSVDINPAHLDGRAFFGEERIPLAATFEGSFKSAFSYWQGQSGSPSAGALSAPWRAKSIRTKIVVVGDGDFVLDGSGNGYHNTMFAVSLVDWLVDEEGLGSIHAREVAQPPLAQMSDEARIGLKCLAFAIPPVLIIIAGLARMAMKASRRRRLGNVLD